MFIFTIMNNMKHLIKYKLFEASQDFEKKRQRWLLSKKYDIIECSHDLTDMPYNFYHCGKLDVEQGERISDVLKYNTIEEDEQYRRSNRPETYRQNRFYNDDNIFRGSYQISYSGEILGKHIEKIHRGFVSGKWDNGFDFDQRDYRPNETINQILPNMEDTIVKLKNFVFNKGEYNIYFMINMYGVQRGTSIFTWIIFKPKS